MNETDLFGRLAAMLGSVPEERRDLVLQRMEEIVSQAEAESLEDVEIVHCPLCQATDPYDIGDIGEWSYQCQACGAEFSLMRGRQDQERGDGAELSE
jgi:transposase-like protein